MKGDVRGGLATTGALSYILQSPHSFVASKYCESTTRSQVNLSHDSSRARRAVGAMSCWGLLAGLLAMDIRTMGRVERWIEPAVLSHILQRPIHSYVALSPPAEEADILATLSPFLYPSLLSSHATGRDPLRHTFDPLIEGSSWSKRLSLRGKLGAS